MAGLVVDRIVLSDPTRPATPPARAIVLAAVALGLLLGALGCAAGLAAGATHSAVQPSVSEVPGPHAAVADDPAASDGSGSHSVPADDRGDRSGSSSMAGSHPGMACVVSVDLLVPAPIVVPVSDSHESPAATMRTGCPDDVDPPVPRPS